jgi:hypothetical protein
MITGSKLKGTDIIFSINSKEHYAERFKLDAPYEIVRKQIYGLGVEGGDILVHFEQKWDHPYKIGPDDTTFVGDHGKRYYLNHDECQKEMKRLIVKRLVFLEEKIKAIRVANFDVLN